MKEETTDLVKVIFEILVMLSTLGLLFVGSMFFIDYISKLQNVMESITIFMICGMIATLIVGGLYLFFYRKKQESP